MNLSTTIAQPSFIGRFAPVGIRVFLLSAALSLWVCLGLFGATATAKSEIVELRLDDYLRNVLDHNESLQAHLLEAEAGHRKARAEWGAFEPEVTASIVRESNQRTNNVQQAAQQGSQFYFSERNTIVDGGLQALLPIGGKVRLGYTLSDLVNNVNPLGSFLSTSTNRFIQQYQTFVGVTLTQPLLKNGGFTVNLAGIRMAALDSEIAFQEYRRQLMLTLSQAEVAYWNLYYAQEQLRFFEESVSVAESILNDSQEKLKAGQSSELEVLESQSGLALRKTKQNEALQSYYEAMSQVRAFTGASPMEQARTLHALDIPAVTNAPDSYAESFQKAFELNPDYLMQRKKVAEEKLRLDVSRNQLLPNLNVKAAYGYNGLGRTPGESWNLAERGYFPSWSLGAELTVPLGGNFKGRHQFAAAQLTYQGAIINLESVQTQIANALEVSIQKARSWQDSIQSYQTVVHFNEALLKTQRERLNVGKIEPRKVLEVEADLLDSRQSLAQAVVQLRRAGLQLQIVGGTLLKDRGMDLSRDELRHKTLALLHRDVLPADVYKPVLDIQPGGGAN